MIISHTHSYLFVEVPHTASHSIAEQLIRHYDGQQILRKHANVTQFLAKASAVEKRYFKFATVRHPLDTAVTDYAKLKGNHKGQFTSERARIENGGHVTKQHRQEFEFVQRTGAEFPEFFKQFRNKLYNNWFLVGDQHLDYVIRFEHLQEGFAEMLRRLGLDQVEPVGHVNPTAAKKRHFEEFYTPDLYPQCARCYGPFMRKWNYEFPRSWGSIDVPRLSRLQFNLIDRSVGMLASSMTMNPDGPLVRQGKAAIDRLTRLTVGRSGS